MGASKWQIKLDMPVHFGYDHTVIGEIDFDLKLVIQRNDSDDRWSLDVVTGKASMSHFDCRSDNDSHCEEAREKLSSREYLDEVSDLLFPFRLNSEKMQVFGSATSYR